MDTPRHKLSPLVPSKVVFPSLSESVGSGSDFGKIVTSHTKSGSGNKKYKFLGLSCF